MLLLLLLLLVVVVVVGSRFSDGDSHFTLD